MSNGGHYRGPERRTIPDMGELGALRQHVDGRLDEQDAKLEELLTILRASRFVLSAIKWCAYIATAAVGVWSAWKGLKP